MHISFSEEGPEWGFPNKTTSVFQKQDVVVMEDSMWAPWLLVPNLLHSMAGKFGPYQQIYCFLRNVVIPVLKRN